MPRFYGRRKASDRRRFGMALKSYRRHRRRARVVRAPRPLSTGRVYQFKQHTTEILGLQAAGSTFWTAQGNNLYRKLAYSLNDVPQATEFSNLYKEYRIKGVRLQMYFSNNVSTTQQTVGGGGSLQAANGQMLLWTDSNYSNGAFNGTDREFLDSQTSKKRLCLNTIGKPIDMFMKLKVLNTVETDASVRVPSVGKNPWINTDFPGMTYQGPNMMIQRVDGEPFTSGLAESSQYCRLITTFYLEFRKVA